MKPSIAWLTIVVLAQGGCGGLPRVIPTASGGATTASGGATTASGGATIALGGITSTGGTAMCEVGGTGSFIGATVCMLDQTIETPPLASGDKAITATAVDPSSICRAIDCPVTRVFELNYGAGLFGNILFLAIASNSENTWLLAESEILLEVTQSGIIARDLGSSWSRPIVDATGAVWLFANAQCGIKALRAKGGVYQSATWSTGDTEDSQHNRLVWTQYDHPFVRLTSGEYHMATLEGSCWSDLQVPDGTVPDVSGRLQVISVCPWDSPTANRTCTIEIHSLEEAMPDEQFSFTAAPAARISANGDTIGWSTATVIIPGGWDNAVFLWLYELPSSGMAMVSYNPAASSHWEQHEIPDSQAVTASGNCPSEQSSTTTCNGLAHCHEELQGRGDYAAVRTGDGAIFAAWLEYSMRNEYDLQDHTGSGEKYSRMGYWCSRTATGGTGTVDLVIARLTDSGNSDAGHSDSTQSRARFRIYEGEALRGGGGDDSIAMATRGDTLAIAMRQEVYDHYNAWYLEIDSTQLP